MIRDSGEPWGMPELDKNWEEEKPGRQEEIYQSERNEERK